MLEVLGTLRNIFKTEAVQTGSFLFYLNYKWTSLIIIGCSLLVASKQYFGDPIDCVFDGNFPSAMVDTYCWIHSTFSLEDNYGKKVGVEVPYPGFGGYTSEDETVHHTYYQWVCLVLFLQSVAFYGPGYLWKKMENGKINKLITLLKEDYSCENGKLKFCEDYRDQDDDKDANELPSSAEISNLEKLLSCGKDNSDNEKKEANENPLSDEDNPQKKQDEKGNDGVKEEKPNFDETPKIEHRCVIVDQVVHCLLLHWDYMGSYGRNYIFCEFMAFVNLIFQILLIDRFLGGRFSYYGWEVIRKPTSDNEVDPMLKVFPKMTKCIFQVTGHQGQVETYDIMCIIPLNIVNEKIYMFLWFWLIALSCATGMLVLYRFLLVTCPPLRRGVFRWKYRYLHSFIHQNDLARLLEGCKMSQWIVLNFLGKNVDQCVFGELIGRLGKYEDMKMSLENRENYRKKMGRSFDNISYGPSELYPRARP